jgi:hypothetical protein
MDPPVATNICFFIYQNKRDSLIFSRTSSLMGDLHLDFRTKLVAEN